MPRINLKGREFGRLKVLSFSHVYRGRTYWLCECECKNTPTIRCDSLTSGRANSCGCLQREISAAVGKENATHSMSKTRLYDIWTHVIGRCYNDNNPKHESYGQRGIKVCRQWRTSYISFERWALSNGYSEDLSIDRINNDGNYEPDNCRWATSTEQQRNKRNTIWYDKERRISLIDHLENIGRAHDYVYISRRIQKKKMTPQDAINDTIIRRK